MENFDDRIKLDIFQYETTYRSDYKRNSKRYTAPPTPDNTRCIHVQNPNKNSPYRDHQTLYNWRENVYIPFNLLWLPKDIIDINPHVTLPVPNPISKSEAEIPYTNEFSKPKPQNYISPAISMDKISDPKMRDTIIRNIYTTDWRIASKWTIDASWQHDNKVKPPAMEKSDRVMMRFTPDPLLPLATELGCKVKQWEAKQTRIQVDPTEQFWQNKDPPVRTALDDPAINVVGEGIKSHLRHLIETDKLRLAHDRPCVTYAGYHPLSAEGVSLCKVPQDVTHPLMTVSAAITKRYEID